MKTIPPFGFPRTQKPDGQPRRNFIVHQCEDGGWAIERGVRVFSGLCWDEMLGVVARLLFTPWELPVSALPCGMSSPEYSLRVSEVENGFLYTIRCRDRFNGPLTSDEMLGFIAQYTCRELKWPLFGGLQTYETWRDRHSWNREREIAGLLTHLQEDVA